MPESTHAHTRGPNSQGPHAVAITAHTTMPRHTDPHCLLPPPPHPFSLYSSCLLSLSRPSQVYIHCLHAHCRLNMGIVTAPIIRQPILTESPALSFSCLSLRMKRSIQQVTSQQLRMTVCGKVLKTALCGWQSVKGECVGFWVKIQTYVLEYLLVNLQWWCFKRYFTNWCM